MNNHDIVKMLRKGVYNPVNCYGGLDDNTTIEGLKWIATRLLPWSKSVSTETVASFFGSRCAAEFKCELESTWIPVSTASFAVVPFAQLAGDIKNSVINEVDDHYWQDNIVEIIDLAIYEPGDVICRVSCMRNAHIFLREKEHWTYTRWNYPDWVEEIIDTMINPNDKLCQVANLGNSKISDLDAVLQVARQEKIAFLTFSQENWVKKFMLHAASPKILERFFNGDIIPDLTDVSVDVEKGSAVGYQKLR